jgi:DNA repair protein RadA/Sms
MVDKIRSIFVCQSCGHSAPRWLGQCPGCEEWNTLVEEAVSTPPKGKAGRAGRRQPQRETSGPLVLGEVQAGDAIRRSTGLAELDRVLGGGLVQGAIVLIGGDPGIGKSTLALQACGTLARGGAEVLYVAGEESPEQVRMRADRLGLGDARILLAAETEVERVVDEIERRRPTAAVIDSIQTLHTTALASAPGSVAQVRESASVLVTHAKAAGTACFVIGHVTKEGALAGPRVLEHLVDTVLYFEGDDAHALRVLRAVKNRFGSTNEVGVFEMREEGLAEVSNPSAAFLAERPDAAPGSAVLPTIEGSRPLLVEIQALVSRSALAMPRRTAIGLDAGRVALLLAVLEKRAGTAAPLRRRAVGRGRPHGRGALGRPRRGARTRSGARGLRSVHRARAEHAVARPPGRPSLRWRSCSRRAVGRARAPLSRSAQPASVASTRARKSVVRSATSWRSTSSVTTCQLRSSTWVSTQVAASAERRRSTTRTGTA